MTQAPVVQANILDPGGRATALLPGDQVGNGAHCVVRLSGTGVSETHATLSLRRGGLWLVASVQGQLWTTAPPKAAREIDLADGPSIGLTADGPWLQFAPAHVPEAVWAVRSASGEVTPLLGRVYCRVTDPTQRWVSSWVVGAAALIWWEVSAWYLRTGDGSTRRLALEAEFAVSGEVFRIVSIPVVAAGGVGTSPERLPRMGLFTWGPRTHPAFLLARLRGEDGWAQEGTWVARVVWALRDTSPEERISRTELLRRTSLKDANLGRAVRLTREFFQPLSRDPIVNDHDGLWGLNRFPGDVVRDLTGSHLNLSDWPARRPDFQA